jgi:drug/metabolite transporter (DMT)-like permease
MPPVAAATAGAVCISSSAVLMKLASTASPSVVALGRCAFALPVLGVLALRENRRWRGAMPGRGDGGSCEGCGTAPMPRRSRWLARLAGVFLAADLILWSHTIAAIGAGLGTVVGNLEVLIISLLAWLVLGERPGRSLVLASPVMLAGLVLVGGLTGVVVAVTGRSPDADPAPEAGYSRRRTRIIRHASAASTDTSPSKSP